jgi:aminomethyltransferase
MHPAENDGGVPAPALKTSPLHERHLALGAKMAEFGGWEMPLEYPSGVLKEHAAVRDSVGIFDVSHLGKATVTGPGAAAYVNATLSNDLGKIAPGKAQYTLCCDDATGGIVDDLIAYLHDDERVFLIPNAANTAEVVRRLAESAPAGVVVESQHESYAVLAVQGTRSDEVLSKLGLPVGHDYMSFVEATFAAAAVTVCRTGYTGERGYELVAPNEVAVELWDALLAAGEEYGVLPCGLGARDTLRTEMGYALHGNELSPTISPVQARVGWAVGWKKEAFWGREALVAEKAAGPARVAWGLLATGRGIPRAHCEVKVDGEVVGEVTSGTFSPTLKNGIALALLAPTVAVGDEVVIDVRGREVTATVVKPPFVQVDVRED